MSDINPLIKYSLVLPIYNEEAVLPILMKRLDTLVDEFDAPAEIIFVDDGSRDTSAIFLEAKAKQVANYRFVKLSRNFGHQIAITAGMEIARGQAIVVMDADLQDPPEVVHQLIAKWKEGNDVVYARRRKRDGETWFKRATASAYYRILQKMTDVDIPRDVGDFRLVDRKVLDAFMRMPERDRFVRGMFAWLGFSTAEVEFDRPARAAGETKYPFWKMLRLAVHGMVSFSQKPLRLALWMGFGVSTVAAMFGLYASLAWLFTDSVVSGWTSIMVVMSFLFGVNLFMTGIVGLYVGGIHAEVKRRPLYVVDRVVGDAEAETQSFDGSSERRLSA